MIDFHVHAGPLSGETATGVLNLAGVSFQTSAIAYVKADGGSGQSCGLVLFFDTPESLDRLITTLVEARKGFPE